MIPAIQGACPCSETSTCAEHERRERARRLLAYWHNRRREDALNTARLVVAAEPHSREERDATVALRAFEGLPHGLMRRDVADLADWVFTAAVEERNERWFVAKGAA